MSRSFFHLRRKKATLDDILLGDQIQQIMVSHRYNPLIVEGGMESHRFYTDNTYLNWILEFGLIGAVLFLTILVPAMFLSEVQQERRAKLNKQPEVQGQVIPVRSIPPLRNPSVPVPQGFSARMR